MRDQMATKDDLARLESQMASRFEALRDEMATKVDLARLESRLARVWEPSKLRLAVCAASFYLLVKDQPDMLGLLGHPKPGVHRPQG